MTIENTKSSYVTSCCSSSSYSPLPTDVMCLSLTKKKKKRHTTSLLCKSQISFKYITLLEWMRSNKDKKIWQIHKLRIIWGPTQWRLHFHESCPWGLFRALKCWHPLRIFSYDLWAHSDSDLPAISILSSAQRVETQNCRIPWWQYGRLPALMKPGGFHRACSLCPHQGNILRCKLNAVSFS